MTADAPITRTATHEHWHGMTVAAYREHHPLPNTPEARSVFGKTRVLHDYSEHWSTPGEYEFPVRLYTEDDVRGQFELYQERIRELEAQLNLTK